MATTFGSRSDFYQGIAIGLIIVGAAGFVVDGFAYQRSKICTSALVANY